MNAELTADEAALAWSLNGIVIQQGQEPGYCEQRRFDGHRWERRYRPCGEGAPWADWHPHDVRPLAKGWRIVSVPEGTTIERVLLAVRIARAIAEGRLSAQEFVIEWPSDHAAGINSGHVRMHVLCDDQYFISDGREQIVEALHDYYDGAWVATAEEYAAFVEEDNRLWRFDAEQDSGGDLQADQTNGGDEQ